MASAIPHADEQVNIGPESQLESATPSITPDEVPRGEYPLCQPGYHEVEYSETDDESDLQEKRKNCPKNPGHTKFIPVMEFTMDHLPYDYRYQLLMDQIYSIHPLTVCIKIRYAGTRRPNPPYPFSSKTGIKAPRSGTGMIMSVVRRYDTEDEKICVCYDCSKPSSERKIKQWGEFSVRTALHVVYHDKKEVEKTTFLVDYDTDAARNTCPKLFGLMSEGGDLDTDISYIRAVSHDKDLCQVLEKRVAYFSSFNHKYDADIPRRDFEDRKRAIVCVSHPHGMSKQISIGEWRGEEEKSPYRWRYTTATCPGSSGAPMMELGPLKNKVFPGRVATHSGARNSSENESGFEGNWWA